MPGILRKKSKDGNWRGWYKSHMAGADGYRKTVKFTGTGSRRDTLAMAHQRQLDEDRIAAGLATAPGEACNWRDFVGNRSGLPGLRRIAGWPRRPPVGRYPCP